MGEIEHRKSKKKPNKGVAFHTHDSNQPSNLKHSTSPPQSKPSRVRSGSHVAECAVNSLALHLQHQEFHPLVEEALTMICKVIAANSVDVMCNCYGSHVLRSLLCLCKGVLLDKSGYYLSKSATVLAERVNLKEFPSRKDDAADFHSGSPNLLNLLVSEMLKHARKCIKALQVDKFSSLVFQTTLRVMAGNDEELLHMIPVLLGCKDKDNAEGNFIQTTVVPEVVLEVSPEALFNELFTKMKMIWEELGPNMEGLFQMGRSGVVASLIAACERLHINEHKCCQVLAKTVCSADESPKWIVPRLLFLDSYLLVKIGPTGLGKLVQKCMSWVL
ncbi:Armadillo-type fold [Sesbania bispinosa]|nr:Armadillo-type fold [Sesbania bispinosa]